MNTGLKEAHTIQEVTGGASNGNCWSGAIAPCSITVLECGRRKMKKDPQISFLNWPKRNILVLALKSQKVPGSHADYL